MQTAPLSPVTAASRIASCAADRMSRGATLSLLHLDAITVEVVEAFRLDGIDPILLKGRAIQDWLYSDGEERPYGDVDLLVSPEQANAAAARLRALGFRPGQRGWRDVSRAWSRQADSGRVDLHTSLFGLYAPPELVWERLSAGSSQLEIAGTPIGTLPLVARTAHVATHAAQHGYEGALKPIEDLKRAIAQVEMETWVESAKLVTALDGDAVFGAGLRMCEEGRKLADELELPPTRSLTAHLHSTGADPLVLGLESLATSEGIREKLSFGARKLAPPASFMRAHFPLARRGTAGLAATYVARPFWIAGKLPGAVRSWRRAKADLERPQDSQQE